MAVHDGIQLGEALELLGLLDTENNRAQLSAMAQALEVHQDRDPRYGNGWRRRGWLGNVADIIRKADRVESMFWTRSDLMLVDEPDDVLDLINYCCFALRNAADRNRTGGK